MYIPACFIIYFKRNQYTLFTVYIYILLSFLFAKQVLDKVRDLLKDVDFFDDFYKCEFVVL